MISIDKNRKIHGRQVQITTYEYEKDAVVVEGRLTDNRFKKTYFFSTEAFRPPGIGIS
ncbi:MAG: hypothetical protein J7K96_01895 [Desulfobacteraceae bacterium]|nr:hypothetical protein [Desulfobacteraceae bacterium]